MQNCSACPIFTGWPASVSLSLPFSLIAWHSHWSMYAAALSGLFLTAADSPWGGVTLHLNVEEDVPIVLPNCNVVVPFKR